MNRREFLTVGGLSLLALTVGGVEGATAKEKLPSYEDALYAFYRYYKVDQYLKPHPKVPLTNETIKEWEKEFLPMYDVEGIAKPVDASGLGDDSNVITPTDISTFDFANGDEFNYVLGRTACRKGLVELNGRYANPLSSWYEDVNWIADLAHEVVHVQQKAECDFYSFDQELFEESAQIGMVEVLSGLAIGGNIDCVHALVSQWTSITHDAAWGFAIQNGRLAEFQKFEDDTVTDTFTKDMIDQGRWLFKGKERDLLPVIQMYSIDPFQLITQAIKRKDNTIQTELEFPNKAPFVMDDFEYFDKHLEKIAKAAK